MRIELFFYKDISLLPPKHITQPDIRTIEFQTEFLSFHQSDNFLFIAATYKPDFHIFLYS